MKPAVDPTASGPECPTNLKLEDAITVITNAIAANAKEAQRRSVSLKIGNIVAQHLHIMTAAQAHEFCDQFDATIASAAAVCRVTAVRPKQPRKPK
jgi:hypothetical protein